LWKTHAGDKYYILFSDGEEVELSTLLGKIMEENLNWNKGGSFRYRFTYSHLPFLFELPRNIDIRGKV